MRDQVALVERLRSVGMRATPQRLAIASELFGNTTHPTVESIHIAISAAMPALSLKTVYEAVREFEKLGEVRLFDPGTGSLRVDPHVETDHQHLVCNRCGSVRDVNMASAEQLVTRHDHNFKIESVDIILRGLCDSCSSTANNKKRNTNA